MTPAQLAGLRRQVGFIWQEYNVVERLSAFKNVLTGRLGHRRGLASLLHFFDRADREIALRSLERVNLLHCARSARRPAVGRREAARRDRARARAAARVLLADEPVASLDVELSWMVMSDLVRGRARRGRADADQPARRAAGEGVRGSHRRHRGRRHRLRRAALASRRRDARSHLPRRQRRPREPSPPPVPPDGLRREREWLMSTTPAPPTPARHRSRALAEPLAARQPPRPRWSRCCWWRSTSGAWRARTSGRPS